MDKTLCFHCRRAGLILGGGTKVPQATRCGQKKKQDYPIPIDLKSRSTLLTSIVNTVFPTVGIRFLILRFQSWQLLKITWDTLLFLCIYLFFVTLGLCCCAWTFLSCGKLGLLSSAWASHFSGFSCCRAWALGAQASVVTVHGFSSCGTPA